MIEPGEVKKYYEWKSGFRSGVVECYLCDAEDSVYFESGRSIKKDLLENELYQISEEEYLSKADKEEVITNVQQEWSSLLGNEEDTINLGNPVNLPNATYSQTIDPPKEEKSPIQIILEKQKKREIKKVELTLEIEVPNEKVIDLLCVMFDEDEVYGEIISQATSTFTIDDLKNLIQNSIIKSIKDQSSE